MNPIDSQGRQQDVGQSVARPPCEQGAGQRVEAVVEVGPQPVRAVASRNPVGSGYVTSIKKRRESIEYRLTLP